MKNKGIDYIICAAGEGTRLQSPKLNIPKPLIKIKGLSLLERSLLSLDMTSDDQLILITQKVHKIGEKINSKLTDKYPNVKIKWLEIEGQTSGQLETATLARNFLRGHGLSIFNSDTFFRSPSLLDSIANNQFDGIIPCSQELGTEWSFCKTNVKGQVVEVAEKVRISDQASVGYYYFKNAEEFLQYSQAEINAFKKIKKECYVAPVYNRYIQDQKLIGIDHVSEFKPMGTPAQIKTYWNMTLEELAQENLEA